MSEWKEISLGENINHKKGFAFKSKDYQVEGRLIVRVSDTTSNSVDIASCVRISEEQAINYSDYELSHKDVVIMTVGSWPDNPSSVVGKVVRIPKAAENALLNQNAVRLRSNGNVNSEFLYYQLKSKNFSNYIVSNAQGSANQASITLNDIFSYQFKLPSDNEQKAIAEFLSSLDDKIDLLHRQNKTLEQMAETLFRQWFVEGAKEEWEFVVLNNYVSCYNGVSYKSSELNPSETAMVTLKSFARDGGFRHDGFKEYTGRFKETHIVKQGDLVVAHTDITQDAALIGNPVLIMGREEYTTLVISMDLVKVEPKEPWISKGFLYYLMRTRIFKQHCIGYSNGSTVLHLNKNAIPSFEFFLPPKNEIEDFTEQVSAFFDKMNLNMFQIRNLEKMRDTLLPKLMSGEIRVSLDG